jgi:hypothetical protein
MVFIEIQYNNNNGNYNKVLQMQEMQKTIRKQKS